ncbi:hypothetical protein ZIOFF_009634 [Zingiber officinale]|uniref:Uncharacterized protein n=1 Tax=Zingiber officinale TaxID=94328 RepID=A0A8J5LRL3_ZINOF|nr:hypothetical protein ZIOFF_009634 [Zingiber officinale]
MEGWEAYVSGRKNMIRNTEKICAYVGGKFSVIKSTIDVEIHACMEALTALKIHYPDEKEITLCTDCHAIIKFFNKFVNNKPSQVRWINFTDYITGTSVDIKFEHISGTSNEFADALSRLVHHITNKPSLSDNQRQFLKQVDESMDEMQRADDTVKEYKVLLDLITQNHLGITQLLQNLLKEQKKLQQAVLQLKKEILQQKPLSKADIWKLVEEITEQPKLIENRTEVIVKESRIQIERIEEIMQEVKKACFMNYHPLSKSKDYDEALICTEEIRSPAIGFICVKEATIKDINRQNNTIIDLLLRINLKLDQLLAKSVPTNTEQILSLTKQLEGLTLGKPRKKEPFYVYQDPLVIYKKEKEKLNGDSK